MLYTDVEVTCINNGHISNWFKLGKGVRQGYPISPYLFIICIENLAHMIRENNKIEGVKINNSEIKLNILADDMVCFLKNLSSMKTTLKLFDEFKTVSGLKINKNKTTASNISNKPKLPKNDFNINWNNEKIDIRHYFQ